MIYTDKSIKLLSLLVFSIFLFIQPIQSFAQDTKRIISNQSQLDKDAKLYSKRHAKNGIWTEQFVYSLSDSLNPSQPITHLQGICWTGSEYWVGVWGGSYMGSIYRVAQDGSLISAFSIIGVKGITGMTVQGDYVYAVNETDKIYIIDKNTRKRVSTITVEGNAKPTFLTFSPEINNGEGGFFAGNFEINSPLYEISLTGELLKIIPSEVHKQRVMTGAAYDNVSAGGPYLWVFNQEEPGQPSEALITQLDANSGQYTGIYHDVTEDFGDVYSAAGGLFISADQVPGKLIMGGVLQSSPSDFLVGYELNFQIPRVDVELNNVTVTEGLFKVPLQHKPDINFSGSLTNRGIDTLDRVIVELAIKRKNEDIPLFTAKDTVRNLAYLASSSFSLGPWDSNDQGEFVIYTELNTGQQEDESSANNVFVQSLTVGDSTMALDDGREAGVLGLGFGAETQTYFGQIYPAKEELFDYLTSITFELRNPKEGDLILASVFDLDPVTRKPLGVPVASTITYEISKHDQDSGAVITLPLADGPYPIFPGEFFIAVREGERPLSLIYSENAYKVGERLLRTDTVISGTPFTGEWIEIENAFASPVRPALMIRPNFGPCVPVYMTGSISVEGDRGSGDGSATVEVSGASGNYRYRWNDPAEQEGATATGLHKDQVYQVTITDTTGCVLTLESEPIPNLVGLEDLPGAGIISLNVHPNPAYEDLIVAFELDRPDNIQLHLIDLKGQTVFKDQLNQSFQYQRRIYIKDLARGIYILEIKTSRGSFRQRIMLR